jgi:hypothetical protein
MTMIIPASHRWPGPAGDSHAAGPGHVGYRSRCGLCPVPADRSRTPNRVAQLQRRPRRPRLPAHRRGRAHRQRRQRVAPATPTSVPRNQPARRVRGRRRMAPLDQAGGSGRRGGIHRRSAHPRLPQRRGRLRHMTGSPATQSTRLVTKPIPGPARYTETHASAAGRVVADGSWGPASSGNAVIEPCRGAFRCSTPERSAGFGSLPGGPPQVSADAATGRAERVPADSPRELAASLALGGPPAHAVGAGRTCRSRCHRRGRFSCDNV